MSESTPEREALLAVIESQQETIRALYAYIRVLAPGAVTVNGHAVPPPGTLRVEGPAPPAGSLAQLVSAAPAALAETNSATPAPPPRRPRFARELLAAGWLVLLVIGAAAAWVFATLMLSPVDTNPELRQVPPEDQGIAYSRQILPGVYPLRELSSGRDIVDRGSPVYVDAEGVRVELAERGLVAIADQGIAFDNPLRPGVYPLKQVSTGLPIADNGRLVFVDSEGRRVPPGQLAAP